MTPILQSRIKYSIALMQKVESLALKYHPDGFYLAFSGGKDSQVLYHIAKEAGVRFTAHMNLTSVDPPEVIRFVKQYYPDVELIKPKASMYDLTIKHRILPTRKIRWCCAEYKELSGAGRLTLLGIRKAESPRRKKRNEFEIQGNRLSVNFDQFNIDREQILTCVKGNDKLLLNPILEWMNNDVWSYICDNNIPYCSLYDEGYTRIGCILCPMQNYKSSIRDIKRYPHAKRKWEQTIQKMIDAGYFKTSKLKNLTAETCFNWWISGKSYDKFYADEFLQGKLDFDFNNT